MNTVEFDENRHFTEHLVKLLAQGEHKTFQCLIADHGLTLTDFVNLTINALLPPPDLTGYYHAVQRYITTGDIQ